MSRNSIHINIPKPCHESWDGMDATAHGAFCHSCQKVVIDYSTMTDREVIEHLTQAKRGCGRFRVDQVESALAIPRVNNGSMKWKALLLGLLPIFATRIAMATPHAPAPTDQKPTDNKDTTQSKPSLPEHITVNGTVENDKGEPLSATITVVDSAGKDLGLKVSSDKKGRFSLQLDHTIYKDHLPAIYVYSHDYVYKMIPLSNEPIQFHKIKIGQRAYIVGEWMY